MPSQIGLCRLTHSMLNNVPSAKPIAHHTCTTGANFFFASRPLTNILLVLYSSGGPVQIDKNLHHFAKMMAP